MIGNRFEEGSIRKIALIIGIVFVACNLRAAITSVGPLIRFIRDDMVLSNGTVGLLTTLPLLAFAFLSPLAPKLGQYFGNEMAVFIGLLILLVGIALRSLGMTAMLFLGTALIGIGIAIGNVLLPSIVKHHFPEKVGLMTSLYSTGMGVFAALASGISVPLAQGLSLGWQGSLVFWAGLVVVAILIWLSQVRTVRKSTQDAVVSVHSPIWKSSLAWQVTLFMGFQSFLFYCTIAWLSEILHSHGMGIQAAGWMLAMMQFASLPATFLTPIFAGRFTNQRGIVIVIGFLYLSGLTGLFTSSDMVIIILSVLAIGLAQGACISLSLALFGLRTMDAQQARVLSGMAQSLGYFLAAIGPTFIGFLFDRTHSWTSPLIVLLTMGVLMVVTGLGAGRNEYVFERLQKREVG